VTSHALTVASSPAPSPRSTSRSSLRTARVAALSRRSPSAVSVTWRIREAASAAGYGLVINARIDVFLPAVLAGARDGTQRELVPEALGRAQVYLEAGADCVFPIALWERDALRRFVTDAPGAVNVLAIPRAPSVAELARLGVARISYGTLLHRDAMQRFGDSVAALARDAADEAASRAALPDRRTCSRTPKQEERWRRSRSSRSIGCR
jgi:2-methylisocitrate lyase-like PEP mutase family enzyme